MLTINRRRLVIGNALGFHLRAAGKFASLAQGYQADIRVHGNGMDACGKSIIELTLLGAGCGASVEIEANGSDAAEALERLANLLKPVRRDRLKCDGLPATCLNTWRVRELTMADSIIDLLSAICRKAAEWMPLGNYCFSWIFG